MFYKYKYLLSLVLRAHALFVQLLRSFINDIPDPAEFCADIGCNVHCHVHVLLSEN